MADLDNHGRLVTSSGHVLDQFVGSAAKYLDSSIVVTGPSKTGKTVIIRDIMHATKPFIDQVIVICPSEPSNQTYAKLVPASLIISSPPAAVAGPPAAGRKKAPADRNKLMEEYLTTLWKRQEMMAEIYTKANSLEVLASLFAKLPRSVRSDGQKLVDIFNGKRDNAIAAVRKRYAREPGLCAQEESKLDEKFAAMLTKIYKQLLIPNADALWALTTLSKQERFSLEYLEFNPRLLLIMDDCAAPYKKMLEKSDVICQLFYQARHCFITFVFVCQDTTDLPAAYRRGAMIMIFTTAKTCSGHFMEKAHRFTRDEKEYVAAVVPDVFHGYRKFVYLREDPKQFYHYTSPFHLPFMFGSDAVRELCKRVENGGDSENVENPFYAAFRGKAATASTSRHA